MQKNKNPFILIILDGWGINKPYTGNAITQGKTPVYDFLWKNFPHTKLCASGRCVGLPIGQDGNSEAGHLNLGAGRIVDQDTFIISKAISSGVFFKNPALKRAVAHIKKHKSAVHLIGLLSGFQSAHVDPKHLLALLRFYREQKIKKVYLHLFTDGRDSFKYGALEFLKDLKKNLKSNEKIASVSGRYYAMDRKKKWERTEKVYNAIVMAKADYWAKNPEEAIKNGYERGETDEFIIPTIIVENGRHDSRGRCIGGDFLARVEDNDAIIFFNLRSDRARQLTKVLVQNNFNKKNKSAFKRAKILKNLVFVAMTDFGPDLDDVLTAFPSVDVKMTLPMTLYDIRQLYISETEKYAHITYFFNGGYADPVNGEERMIVPSPDVASYDLKPEMSAFKITDTILEGLENNKHDFICVNFANPDMVGHTGNLTAGIKAVEAVDLCLNRIYKTVENKKGVMIVTSDHGNVEEMINEKTGEVDTKHSNFPVPFILADFRSIAKKYKLKENGILANVAPTILELLGRSVPKEMTEKSLIIK